MKKILFPVLFIVTLLASACGPAPTPTPAAVSPATGCDCAAADWRFPFVQTAHFKDLKEPSGIIFHPQLNSLFVAGDKGHLTQLSLDGNKLKEKKLQGGANYEGITLDPATGLLYLAVEAHDRIVEVDPNSFDVLRQIELDRKFEGKELINAGNGGVEGIAFIPGPDGGSFLLANQSKEFSGPDPSIIFEVKIDDSAGAPVAKIVRYFSLGVTDMSDLYFDAERQQLYVISDTNNLLLITNLAGEIEQTYALPGETQEGITFDNTGALYIAQDSGSVLKFAPAQP